MLFHVDVDLGILSILVYTPGLTCQKVHLRGLSYGVFSTAQCQNVSVCPLLSVCAPHAVMKDFLCLLFDTAVIYEQ